MPSMALSEACPPGITEGGMITPQDSQRTFSFGLTARCRKWINSRCLTATPSKLSLSHVHALDGFIRGSFCLRLRTASRHFDLD
ncbi:hypothetical protein CEXT_509121 [Caerostris extrusa]|uniref:Uncharacterized protein n=1 Tax=Caerostris extrusa TaxID=172846 RepID=A0AAV4UIW3_CAEEX|nr:hypothetical protein CEXT_509121 [Caerostris extrusa]